jgi:arylformamidase
MLGREQREARGAVNPVDLEAEYNNRARVPEHPAIFERWKRDAAAFRAGHANAELDLSYGGSERTKVDIFWSSPAREARIALFIHGGYWRALDKSLFSHLAAGANARGIAVAMPGYDLCPAVTLAVIIEEMREAAGWLWRRHHRRLMAAGHSAGGHLAACLVATDWAARDLPADLVTTGLSISGLFDLAPLVGISANEEMKLDAAEARRVSPLYWELPPSARALDAWVGGDESGEFLRASRSISQAWGGKGIATRYVPVAGANHFTVIDPLADAQSALTGRLVELTRAIA